MIGNQSKNPVSRVLLRHFRVALSAVKRIADLIPKLYFILWVLAAEKLCRVELEVICVVETLILIGIVTTRLKLLEPDVLGALHHQVFIQRFFMAVSRRADSARISEGCWSQL